MDQTARTFQMGFVESPDFDFHNTYSSYHSGEGSLEGIGLIDEINWDESGSLESLFTSSHANSQFHGSPQPSYPLKTVDENKTIVDDDHEEINDLQVLPNNQEIPYEPSVLDFGEYLETRSPYHRGDGSIDEINWDELRSLYPSTQHSMQDTSLPLSCEESGYKENEPSVHTMPDTLPIHSGGLFSDSSAACWESEHEENEEINPKKKRESGFKEINPKKKQPRLEHPGEGEGSCKKCICKKSKCLMLYCGCFAAGVFCEGSCDCINCFNTPIHKDTVIAARKQIERRKSLALAPKPIRWSDSFPRQKRGCSCKKGCHMKYCGCYQGGVGCSSSYCRCEGCKNKFNGGENNSSGLTTNPSSSVASVFKFDSPAAPTTTTTTTSSSVLEDKDQCFGGSSGSLLCNVAAASTTFGFGSAVAPDYYLQSSSLLANPTKPLVSDFPVFFQQMASSTPSAFGFVGQENQFPTPFHLRSQFQY